MTKVEENVFSIVSPKITDLGYSIYDIEYLKEGQEYYLRIFIEKEDKKIDLDDCEKVSNEISVILDEKDPISTSYNLEVSSCGLEKRLREKNHFLKAINQKIVVNLFKTQDGKKETIGILKEVNENDILLLDEDNNNFKIDFNNIANAKIYFDFDKEEL